MTEPNGDLTPRAREALAALPREAAPPPSLEEATVRALAARGLLRRPPRRRPRPVELGLALAASVLLFLGGLAVGRREGSPPPAPAGTQFALLLYEGPEYRHAASGEEAERVREYGEWAGLRAERGELVAGEKLREEPDLVIGADATVTTAPRPAGAPRLAGFFIVRAADRAAALEIARSCPHVRYGGSIVIREIEPT
ncbi:MAG TPA: YciI family protein [Gemmatimonadales bacterium]|nr:YciI family protein [Gemmatimonadales bacterium]